MQQSPITFASLLGLLFTVVLFTEQVNASCDCKDDDHACFPADGGLLKQAVDEFIAADLADVDWDGMINGVYYGSSMSEWDTSCVTVMAFLFFLKESFNEDISDWDVSSVKDMQIMFYGATSFNQDISDWDVSKVQYMQYMFFGATAFNQDISDWDVSKVEDMDSMFYGASSFNQNLCAWKYKDFPYGPAAYNIFLDSACIFPADPVLEDQGPFCSDDCGAPSSTPSSNPSRSSEPSSQPSLSAPPSMSSEPSSMPSPSKSGKGKAGKGKESKALIKIRMKLWE
eukprot:scaffold37787_cov153-Skeletonema_marinoi.AAC.15